jgi:hypothetical protein
MTHRWKIHLVAPLHPAHAGGPKDLVRSTVTLQGKV